VSRSRPYLLLSVLLLAASLPLAAQQELTIPAIFADGGITGRGPETLRFSPDGKKLSFVQRDDAGARGQLYYLDVESGEQGVLVSEQKLAGMRAPSAQAVDEREQERLSRYAVAGYHWSPDSRHILFDTHGLLWLYSLETGTAVQVAGGAGVRDPKFSPDGRSISYVRGGDLYVADPRRRVPHRLTSDGSADILNGDIDWVYAEELDVRSNYFWSPDGTQIAYLQMDQRPVPTHPITDLVPVRAGLDLQKYPKAGDPNPVVRVGVAGVRGGRTRWLALTDEKDVYVPRFGWVRPGLLYVYVLNRAHDQLDLYFVDSRSGRSRRVLRETSPDAWIESYDELRVLGSDRFLWASWRDGHTHLYLYRFSAADPLGHEAVLERQLTRGGFEVFEVAAVDEETATVYFVANADDARQRHLFTVQLDGSGMRRVSTEPGTHSPSFSPGGKHYVNSYQARQAPPRMELCRAGGGECRVFWQSRDVSGYRLSEPRFVSFHAADGTELLGTLLVPPDFEERRANSVPLILAPYGGPYGQTSRDTFGGPNRLFHEILARRGFAILQVDNRGMGARGRQFAAALRRNMGSVEVEDQLAALDQALGRWPQLDGSRAGFWGWSYGGYMTLRAMTLSARFRAGVSVAPVSDWHFYDTIYTERYMGLPKENREGYERSAPLRDAGKLSGRLLLVHGTSDDNVHLQNSIAMVDALISAGKQFDLLLYPRKTHGIAGTAARTHLFTRMQQHFEEHLLRGAGESQVAGTE
jgi:dipeptidyl-peptidase-4